MWAGHCTVLAGTSPLPHAPLQPEQDISTDVKGASCWGGQPPPSGISMVCVGRGLPAHPGSRTPSLLGVPSHLDHWVLGLLSGRAATHQPLLWALLQLHFLSLYGLWTPSALQAQD